MTRPSTPQQPLQLQCDLGPLLLLRVLLAVRKPKSSMLPLPRPEARACQRRRKATARAKARVKGLPPYSLRAAFLASLKFNARVAKMKALSTTDYQANKPKGGKGKGKR